MCCTEAGLCWRSGHARPDEAKQELQKVKDPSFEKLMKMKRKNGFLSRKKKKVATEKNSAAGNIETKVVKRSKILSRVLK